MTKDIPIPLFLDASVLINFLRVDRLDLVTGAWVDLRIVEEVQEEVTDSPQGAILEAALESKLIQVFRVEDLNDISLMTVLHETHGLGWGESASLAGAKRLQARLAIDDVQAIKKAGQLVPEVVTITTKHLIVAAMKKHILSLKEAESLQEVWAKNHRFRLQGQPNEWLLEGE